MFLSKLEIQGFKSFAEKTVLEFNRELTAIVGPNGSGKSNVADAIRWGLGEQSLKTLRGKKAEDVIFAGTDKKPRLGFAEVNLTLDNSAGLAPLDYAEIVITRRLYRSGESEYLINKNKVRLLDIQLMLAKASFGQRTYSIIGQGMIDSILLASPTERKEFFDEATGVRSWQLKKEQAAGKLESAQENLRQSEAVIAEIEPRLRSLSRQVKRLERKSEIETELKIWQQNYYSQLTGELSEKIKTLSVAEQVAVGEKNIAATTATGWQTKIDEEQLKDTAADAFAKLQREVSRASEEKNQLSRELSLIKSRLELKLAQTGKMDAVWLNNRLEELERKLAGINAALASSQKEETLLANLLTSKQTAGQQLNAELAKINQEIKAMSQKNSPQDKLSAQKISQKLNDLYIKQKNFLASLRDSGQQINLENIAQQAEAIMAELKELADLISQDQPTGKTGALTLLQEQLNELLVKKEASALEINELKTKQQLLRQKNEQWQASCQELVAEKTKLDSELKTSYAGHESLEAGLAEQKIVLEEKIKVAETGLSELEKQLEQFSDQQKKQKEELIRLQQNLRQAQEKLNAAENKLNEIKIELARAETKEEDLLAEISAEFLGEFKATPLAEAINTIQAQAEISRLKSQLAVIGAIDQESISEYQAVQERYTFLNEQITDLTQAISSCREIIEELEKKISLQFESAFIKINDKFKEYFKILFNGGQAQLILKKKEIGADDNNTGEETAGNENENQEATLENQPNKKRYEIGIEIEATPPGKRLKAMAVLSGGEKALTSIALISAIMANNPSPFVVLDEVDAALDEANSERFAQIVKDLSDKTQFICITHNRATMAQAGILYGVTMGSDGVSKLLSVNLTEAEKVAE